jgi:hypothetical protein
VDGVLGGYSHVNEPDISCSDDFLKIILSERFSADVKTQPLVALGIYIFSFLSFKCNMQMYKLCFSINFFIIIGMSDLQILEFQIVVLALVGLPKIY